MSPEPNSRVRLARLILLACAGALLGAAVLGVLLQQMYQQGRSASVNTTLMGALVGVLGGVCLEVAMRMSEPPYLRFTVRSLLLGMTLLAVILGAIAFAAQYRPYSY